MKKKVFITLTLIALTTVSLFIFAGCGTTGEIDTYTAEDIFSEVCGVYVYRENAHHFYDWDLKEHDYFTVQQIKDGTPMDTVWGMDLLFKNGSPVFGKEVGVVQFAVEADRDVDGYFKIEYAAKDVKSKLNFVLKANEKKVFTINLDKNFKISDSVFSIRIRTDINEYSDAWREWAKTKYSYSDLELALNE